MSLPMIYCIYHLIYVLYHCKCSIVTVSIAPVSQDCKMAALLFSFIAAIRCRLPTASNIPGFHILFRQHQGITLEPIQKLPA